MEELILGVDIGGTNTAYGLIAPATGCIVGRSEFSTADCPTPEAFVVCLKEKVDDLVGRLSGRTIRIAAIGVGVPNGNRQRGTIEFAPNLPWKGQIALEQLLRAVFPGVAVVIDNDANAAAMGEMLYGGAKGMAHFVEITIGTGLGSGFVVNHQLLYGADGMAGELGHVIVEPDGRMCGCGRKGCLERYVSAAGMQQTLAEFMDSGLHPDTCLHAGSSPKDIAQAAAAGDALAQEVFRITGQHLGRALANVVAMVSPEAFFVFGGVAHAGDLLLAPTRAYMQQNLMKCYTQRPIPILLSSLSADSAALLGAAALTDL